MRSGIDISSGSSIELVDKLDDKMIASEVASICELSGIINCLLHVLLQHTLEAMLPLPPDQQSGIHCQMISGIQLFTLNNFSWT